MRMRAPGQPTAADTLLSLCLVLNEVHMRTIKQLHKRLVHATLETWNQITVQHQRPAWHYRA